MGKASNGKTKSVKPKSDHAARNNVWRKRIVGYGDEDPRKLKANDANWRLHPQAQHDAMDGALDEIGWIQDIIVNLRTSAEWNKSERNVKTTLDGHLRVERALAKNEASVPVKFVDLTPNEELTALATFDPLSAMAQTDGKKLQEALARLEVESAGLQALTAQLEQQAQDAIAALGVNAEIGTWADAFGNLPSGERPPFQQITFTLHDTQVEQVKAALELSKRNGVFVDSLNENSNGNAIARICETYIGQNE